MFYYDFIALPKMDVDSLQLIRCFHLHLISCAVTECYRLFAMIWEMFLRPWMTNLSSAAALYPVFSNFFLNRITVTRTQSWIQPAPAEVSGRLLPAYTVSLYKSEKGSLCSRCLTSSFQKGIVTAIQLEHPLRPSVKSDLHTYVNLCCLWCERCSLWCNALVWCTTRTTIVIFRVPT